MAFRSSTIEQPIPASLLPSRRYLVLYLLRWATDTIKRREPALGGPLVLYEKIKGGLRLAAVDGESAAKRLSVGQNLADARAMVPGLVAREIDRSLLEAIFADFADWHSNASPLVSVLTDMSAFGDLVLDIAGVAHLFGGEAAMLRLLLARLRERGYTVSGAVASTIGAAWAASHFGRSQIVPPDQTGMVLDEFSVAALRLNPFQVTGLTQMGLKRIGQLRGRDRKGLQARFGVSLLQRLDQAYGLIEEQIVPRLPVAERYAERRFADPIGLMDDVLMCAHDLAVQLAIRLEGEGLGAQAFHLFLYRVDHKVMTLSINSGRPTRDAAHIARLFANRSERLEGDYDAGFGVDMIRLAASSVSELDPAQLGVFETQDGAQDLDQLYDRMSSRLGALAVVRSAFVNTHIPERVVKLEPVIARTLDDPLARPAEDQVRPLRLLPAPEPIIVFAQVPDGPPNSMVWRRVSYKFVKAAGPERLGMEWWRAGMRLHLVQNENHQKGLEIVGPAESEAGAVYQEGEFSRDYYSAEDSSGRRFWLFRQGLFGFADQLDWFMQGFFS